ncbi:MAG: DUF362 domain-containing protein [Kiritimatiellae bacterium]|nr:DUF362 domain-containing protein [Kiritimatiellia bacterium]
MSITRVMAIVAQVHCASYSDEVESALRRALALLGGPEKFLPRGGMVLLKPNMLSARTPAQAVTTHPQVVRALIRIVKACGGRPVVGDSPANVMRIEEVWERTGIAAVCAAEHVPLVKFESAGARSFQTNGFSFAIAKPVLEADAIINIPKVKTHVLTILTGAVKNMYGTVPGFLKTSLHKEFPSPARFGALLAEIYGATKPHLNVADGIVGMEGDGPSGGKPIPLRFLMASDDGVALDTTLCGLLGINQNLVPCFAPLRNRHLGETEPQRIEVRGDPAGVLRPSSFRVPGTLKGRLVPSFLARFLGPYLWIRPSFTNRCYFCGMCLRTCPTGAITMADYRPSLDGRICIGCCCCHEVCPNNAVTMRMSPLLRLLRGGKPP